MSGLLRKIRRNMTKGKYGNCDRCGRALHVRRNVFGDRIWFCPKKCL